MFRTELDRAIAEPCPAARIITHPAPRARVIAPPHPGPGARPGAGPCPAASGGRVISPHVPQPPQLGGEPPLYDDGVLRITRMPGPGLAPRYALGGEIDESTVRGLAGTLAEIAVDLDEVHLDLGALDYTDLAGLRVIVQLTGDGRRRVVLHQLPPHLRTILVIVGWDTAPGLELTI